MEKVYKLIADGLVLRNGAVLLVKYDFTPDGQEGWFLPDDLLKYGEAPEKALHRILKDQTDLTVKSAKLAEVESFIGKDKSWHLVFHYQVEVSGEERRGEGVKDLKWFPLNELPPAKEFAHHGWGRSIIQRLTKK
ncbi:NUDIX hydrolase [candidate division TA06 bacterium]|nr:NUDIX hydrolase [candidate division TA06 bacterium]